MPERTPRLTPRILRVLITCFNSAEAGGFSGDTEGLNFDDTEATEQWLDAWRKKYGKKLAKIEEESEDEKEEEDD
jgi:hypothetical protein